MPETWVTGLVNGILYNAMFRNAGAELDEDLARRFAVALRVEPISRQPLSRQAAGLRAAVASDAVLASAFEPYPGQRPYGEAEFRAFLTLLEAELESGRPQPAPALLHRPFPGRPLLRRLLRSRR